MQRARPATEEFSAQLVVAPPVREASSFMAGSLDFASLRSG